MPEISNPESFDNISTLNSEYTGGVLMRSAVIYNFLIEANIIAGIAILLMIPVRKFLRKSLGNRAICFA